MDSVRKLLKTERKAFRDDVAWLESGGKMLSADGADVTEDKRLQLHSRLDHIDRVLADLEEA